MHKQRLKAMLEKSLLGIAALYLLLGILALGFLPDLCKENRALITIGSSIGIFACFIALLGVQSFWKWLRRRVWLRTMSAWNECSREKSPPKYEMACHLSEDDLRVLAVQSYTRMGYRVVNKGQDAKDFIRLLNPEGEIELVACKQQAAPIEIRDAYALYAAMKREDAVSGCFWAPRGGTAEAIYWAKFRSLILADQDEIGRLVDCAHLKGSILLEN